MILQLGQDRQRRLGSALAVAALHVLLGYAFLTGLGARFVEEVSEPLKLFDAVEEPPPPPAEPPPPEKVKKSEIAKPKEAEGAASPGNLKDTPTQIVAPPPEVRLPVPPPVTSAPIAGQGNAPAAGAAEVPGPGTGRGGTGQGLGNGRYGDGTGGGGGGLSSGTPAEWVSGRIYDTDWPRSVRSEGGGSLYRLFISFVVAPTGRVTECRVTKSSGNRALDATTCRLILRRFRYRPARDGYGNRIAQVIHGEHEWESAPEQPPVDEEPAIPDDE